MTPEEFPPLVTDYQVDWDYPGACGHDECKEKYEARAEPGDHYEHGFVSFDNGYTVSLMRAHQHVNGELFVTDGFEDGLWEAAIGVPANPLVKLVLGVEFMPPENPVELGFQEDGRQVNLNNADVNALLVSVGALPAAPSDEVGIEDLGGLFG